jgi:hypothetical protein
MEERNIHEILAKKDVVDATLATTAGETLKRIYVPGKKLGFMPNPVDFSIESGRNHERRDLPFDLFYACGNENDPRFVCGRNWTSAELIAHIACAAPQVRILSPGVRGQPHLAGGKYQRALESATIGLNVSRRNDLFLYSSDRLAQLVGNGLAVLIDRATGYESLLAENEFVYFSSLEELLDKLDRLISDPAHRQRVAAAGRARYHELFNERVVARYIVDVAFDRWDPRSVAWPSLYAF